jgi:hypothetical protein
MARSHGKILASAWSDPDWTSLAPKHQWMYWTLLGQPKLTLVGVMDYMPTRWARGCAGTSVERIVGLIADLERRDYVVVDHDTGELLIRTFVRHDGIEQANVNLKKGMWSAWSAVASLTLRKVAVDNMPDGLWADDLKVPAEAVRMRSEPPLERASEQASEPPIELTCIPSLHAETPTPVVGTVVLDRPPMPKIDPAHKAIADDELARLRLSRAPGALG